MILIRFRHFLAVLLALCSFSGLALAQTEYVISGVSVEGTRNISAEAVKTQLKHASGRVTSEDISEDLKSLYQTEFFDQITASVVYPGGPGGGAILKYSVLEKPLVRKVFIKGNDEVSESELSKILTFGPRRFMDRGKVDALVRAAVAYYQQEGFYDAELDYSVVPVSDGLVDLTFSVKEGERVKIREIEVKGLDQIDEDDLLSAMETRRYKWWNSWLFGTGSLNRDMLENDKLLARQYFLDNGYLDGSVGDPVVERKEDGLYITFFAKEGSPYKIEEITVSGDLVEDSFDKTLEGIDSKPGETFSASVLREDTFKITDKFADKGYAFANVVPDTRMSRDTHEVSVNFEVDKGKLITVDRINIKGNNKTYDNVIRREMVINEQELYSSSKVRRSQELLKRLGYFEEVTLTTEPTDKEDHVNLDLGVREAPTGSFSIGAGFSSSEGVLFNTRLTENNLFGTGRNASINFDVGDERQNIIVSLDDRRFMDTYVSMGLDGYKTFREFSDFDRDLQGGAYTIGYPLEQVFGESLQDISASLKFEYLDIEISNVDREDAADLVIASEGPSSAAGITPKLVRNTLNNVLDPSKGSLQEASFEFTGFGGSQEYFLLEGRNQFYQPLAEVGKGELVFAWRVRVGYGEARDDDPFPLFRRYFPGGINSVRGFRSRSLGPKDSRGNEYGGSKELVNNLELIMPLVSSAGLKLVGFYDLGEAFDDDQSIDLSLLRQAYGAGIRWSSPVGPIRIEFGFPIDKEEGETSMVTMFSFGTPY